MKRDFDGRADFDAGFETKSDETNARAASGTAFRRNETSNPTDDGGARNGFDAQKRFSILTSRTPSRKGGEPFQRNFPRFLDAANRRDRRFLPVLRILPSFCHY
ncbi:MAG: hypothetical protein IKY61_06755 [Thermoguttaceae bacterium]|nr:hypothetical protein [Thermoguttaceae bacterium]